MSSFACYWPWLLGGAALGWLCWQLFDRLFRRDGDAAGVRLTREVEAVSAKASSLQADLTGANGRLSLLKADVENGATALKAKSDEALRIRSELTDWMAKHGDLETQMKAAGLAATATAAAAAVALKSAHDKHDALKAEFDTAFRSLNSKTDELTRTSSELGEWKVKYTTLDTQSKGTAAELADWKARHTTSETQAKATFAELGDWKAKHATTETHAIATAAELTDWKARHATTEAQVKAAAADLADWKGRHATLDAQAKSAATELADWKARHAAAEAQGKASATELAEWRSKHASAESQAKSVSADLAASTSTAAAAALAAAAAIAALQAKFDRLQSEVAVASGALTTRTAEATRLAAEVADWKVKSAAAETQERAATAGLMSARTAAANAATASAAALTASNDKYAALRKEHETLIATLKSDHERAARSLHTDLDSTRQTLRSKSDEAGRLSAELADWKARYATLETQSRQSLKSANTVALAASLGFKPQKGGRDDLTIVEGIGPKINELLIAGGIDTFVKLSSAPVERVQAILDAAGPSFRLAKPASWARQAELCAGGEWEALKALQDALTAGVDTDKA